MNKFRFLDVETDSCPFCGKKPSFNIIKIEESCNNIYIYYNFGCENCGVYAPKPSNRTTYYGCISLSLSKDGEVRIFNDNRKDDIASWNCRVK